MLTELRHLILKVTEAGKRPLSRKTHIVPDREPVVTGDAPSDVLNYAASNRPFPHQGTADQWFDESQFESHRMLGRHSIDAICGERRQGATLQDLIARAEIYVQELQPATLARAAAATNP